jgi:hypothetical protein
LLRKIAIEAYGMEIEGLVSSTSEDCFTVEILSPFKFLSVDYCLSRKWLSKEKLGQGWPKHCEGKAEGYLLALFKLCCYFKDDPKTMLNRIKKTKNPYTLLGRMYDLGCLDGAEKQIRDKLLFIWEKGLNNKPDFCIIDTGRIISLIKIFEYEKISKKIEKEKRDQLRKEKDRQDRLEERLQESFERKLETKSVLLALQDWDSGGPGAGAGEVVLYLLDRKCYLSDDSGISEYKEEQVEKALKSILRITDATRRVIVTEELRRVLISIGSTETAEGLFKNLNNVKKATKRKGLMQYSMYIKQRTMQ